MRARPDHVKRARMAWPLLVRRASTASMTPFTYGELASAIGLHHRAARYFLGVIQRYCHDVDLPPLQALAVNKQTRLPGIGYRGSLRTHSAHAKALRKVAIHAWPKRPPDLSCYR